MIKKGTISQFEEIDIIAAQNEASNFDFGDAYQDWKANTTNRNTSSVAFTWFVAGIIVGKGAMVKSMQTTELADEMTKRLNAIHDLRERLENAEKWQYANDKSREHFQNKDEENA